MCDACGMVLGYVFGQKHNMVFHPIYYASLSLNGAHLNYTISEQGVLLVVYSFENFRAYLLVTKVIMSTDRLAMSGDAFFQEGRRFT